MSARAWHRRRRNKYLSPYVKYVDRHQDHVLVFPTGRMMASSIVQRAMWNGGIANFIRLREYRKAVIVKAILK